MNKEKLIEEIKKRFVDEGDSGDTRFSASIYGFNRGYNAALNVVLSLLHDIEQ